MRQTFRFFLSSPEDLFNERQIVRKVVDRINAEARETATLDLFLWEEQFYTADQPFQSQTIGPAECDIVLVLFWKRLGTELPPQFQRPDGSLPTGTEFEFEQALKRAIESNPKTPDVFVYRKMASVVFSEENLEQEKAQRDRFLAFWEKWFHSEKGHFVAAFQTFLTEAEFEQQLERHLRGWLDARRPAANWRGGSPFRGLQSFEVEQADIFFGREREICRARARLLTNAAAGTPILFISGASGSGKSSLIRAGLLASVLRPGAIPSFADQARFIVETPSTLAAEGDWAEGLSKALYKVKDLGSALAAGDFEQPEAFSELLRTSPRASVQVLKKALKRLDTQYRFQERTGLFIVIDQFEEVFSYSQRELEAFTRCLVDLVESASSTTPLALVIGIRSDHRHYLQKSSALSQLAGFEAVRGPGDTERFLDVLPPGKADLREIILRPANLAGLSYENNLETEENLSDLIEAEAKPDTLPALQLLLSELYERRHENELTIAAYRAVGGIKGVMATIGEETLAQVPENVRKVFPRLLRQLATKKGDEAVRARTIDASVFTPEQPEAQLVAAFVKARLVVSEGSALRVAHESLLRDWPLALEYIEKDWRFFEVRERLGEKARRFAMERNKKIAKRMLLKDLDLSEGKQLIESWGAESVADVEPLLPAFVDRSLRADRRRRLAEKIRYTTLAGIVVLLGFVFWKSEDSKRRANVNFHIAKANAALRSDDNVAAVQAISQAAKLEDNFEVNSALAATLSEFSPNFEAVIEPSASAISWGSPKLLNFADSRGIGTFDVSSRSLAWSTKISKNAAIIYALNTLSNDKIITVSYDGRFHINQQEISLFNDLEISLAHAGQVDISVGSSVLVTIAGGQKGAWVGTCDVFETLTCERKRVLNGRATAVAFSNDGTRLAVGYERDDSLPVVAVYDSVERGKFQFADDFAVGAKNDDWLAIDWSPDNNEILLGSRKGVVVRALIAEDGEVQKISKQEMPVTAVGWSPLGRHFATACNGNAVCLYRSADGASIDPLLSFRNAVIGLAFSPDGKRLATRSINEPTRVWTVGQDRNAVSTIVSTRSARFEAIDAASGALVAGDKDGYVQYWSDIDALPIRLTTPRYGHVVDVAISESGAIAATYNTGLLAIWRSPKSNPKPDLVLPILGAKRVAWSPDKKLAFSTKNGKVGFLFGEKNSNIMIAMDDGDYADSVAAIGPDLFATSLTSGKIVIWSSKGVQRSIPAIAVDDNHSAFSLNATPDRNWLIATRNDDILRIYGLGNQPKHVDLRLLRRNSKAALFSPSGARIAALDAEGTLYVWRFDTDRGLAAPLFTAPAVPQRYREITRNVRAAVDLDWLSDDKISIGTANGKVIVFDVRSKLHRKRAKIATEIK